MRKNSFVVHKLMKETKPSSCMSSLSFLLTDSESFYLAFSYMKRTDFYQSYIPELDW